MSESNKTKELTEQQKQLVKLRHDMGLFTVKEISVMFGCGRKLLDDFINSGQLKYLSPNNKDRFVYLNEFMELMNKDKNQNLKGEEQ